MQTVHDHAPAFGVRLTCAAVGIAPATFYRHRPHRTPPVSGVTTRPVSPRALAPAERQRGSTCCTRRALPTSRRRRSTPLCSTKARITARSARCTACWPPTTKCVSGGRSDGIRSTPRPNSSPPRRTSSGAGISRGSRGGRNGRTFHSTSCSMSSVATSSAGSSPRASPPRSPNG
jgi:hypothetical protein